MRGVASGPTDRGGGLHAHATGGAHEPRWVSAHVAWAQVRGGGGERLLARLAADPSLLRPDDPFAAAGVGIALRDRDATAAAEAVFQTLIAQHPGEPYGWHELAVLKAATGQREAAEPLFQRALTIAPDNLTIRTNYALHLARVGRVEAAKALVREAPSADPQGARDAAVLLEFLDYLSLHPQAEGLELARRLDEDPRRVDAASLEAQARAALANAQPFSMIRLGDGEGAWITTEDSRAFPQLFDANRREILAVWFGEDGLASSSAFVAAVNQFGAAVEHADVVGVPYPARIAHEYALLSRRGVSCCVNALARMAAAPRADQRICSHDIHLDLQLQGGLARLLAPGVKVGVISCHPGLAYRLAESRGVRILGSYILPVERVAAAVIGPNGVQQPHFPQLFRRIGEKLARADLAGTLWLVAGGFLGKVYCDQIRAAGGVALDIGSVADGWAGKATRPTLREIERFAL